MTDTARLLVAAVAVLLIVGLIAYARGTEHHRGTEIGEHPAIAPSLRLD